MKADPPIDEIRETRRQISAEFDHDPRRLMAHYAEIEKLLQREGKFRFADAPVDGNEHYVLNDKPSQKEK